MTFIDYIADRDQIVLKLSPREIEVLVSGLALVRELEDRDLMAPGLADDLARQDELVAKARQLSGSGQEGTVLSGSDFCDMSDMLHSLVVARVRAPDEIPREEFTAFVGEFSTIFIDQYMPRRFPRLATGKGQAPPG